MAPNIVIYASLLRIFPYIFQKILKIFYCNFSSCPALKYPTKSTTS